MKKYYFKEKFFKITDKYPILDEYGKKVFFFDQDFKFVGYKASLKDMDDNKLFTINRKTFSLLKKYFIDFHDGTKMEVDEKLSFLKRKINVKYENLRLNLKGSVMDYDFEVFLDRDIVADMNKKIFSLTDQYELTVYREDLTLPLIALCLCLNNIKDEDSSIVSTITS